MIVLGISILQYYCLTPTVAKGGEGKALMDAVVRGIYWATHPVNEALLLPSVVRNTHIHGAYIPKASLPPEYLPKEEYFDIRTNTAPTGTHCFLVAAADAKAIKPFGLLKLIP